VSRDKGSAFRPASWSTRRHSLQRPASSEEKSRDRIIATHPRKENAKLGHPANGHEPCLWVPLAVSFLGQKRNDNQRSKSSEQPKNFPLPSRFRSAMLIAGELANICHGCQTRE